MKFSYLSGQLSSGEPMAQGSHRGSHASIICLTRIPPLDRLSSFSSLASRSVIIHSPHPRGARTSIGNTDHACSKMVCTYVSSLVSTPLMN